MDVFAALLLFVVMYLVVPVAVCVIALVLLGGAERFLPRSMQSRTAEQHSNGTERH